MGSNPTSYRILNGVFSGSTELTAAARGSLSYIAVVLLLLFTVGCSSSKSRVDPPAELVEFEPLVTLERVWSKEYRYIADTIDPLTPVIEDGRIYFGDAKGYVTALQQVDGKELWRVGSGMSLSAIGYAEGVLLLGSHDGELLALDSKTGEELWRTMLSSEVLSAPVGSDGTVFVRTADSKVFALDAADGEYRWSVSQKQPLLLLRGESRLLLDDGTVYAGFANGKILALSRKDGQVLWSATIAIPQGRSDLERMVDIDSNPLLDSGVIYVAAFQGRLAAIGQKSGSVFWERDISIFNNMAIDENRIFVSDELSHLWALERRGGASLWRQEKLYGRQVSAPVIYGDYIVVSDYEGYVHLLSQEEGQFVSRYQVDKKGLVGNPVVSDGVIYLIGKSGRFVALGLAGPK